MYPDDMEDLYNEEREAEGLPPVGTVETGRKGRLKR
jgi:hypothetical protein